MGLTLIMAFLVRACGASWKFKGAEYLFALPFGCAAYISTGSALIGFVGYALSYFGMQTGHGRFYAMKGANLADSNPEFIERYIASWAYRGDITKPAYSWFCMGIKGLIIGLAAFPFGLALAVLWPLSYWASIKLENDTAMAEWLSGGFAGIVLTLALSV